MEKRNFLSQSFAFLLFIITSPFLFILYILTKTTSKGPFFFKQLRLGKDKKPFWIYKIRTMISNAEQLKYSYRKLNEADGPVFKIKNDPRYTRIGKYISHTGFDELPQLINVIKGEMSFVGPRPLPVNEAIKISKIYRRRFSVLPGITSSWVIKGSHRLSFKKWMELDLEYIERKSVWYDMKIALQTVFLILHAIKSKIQNQ